MDIEEAWHKALQKTEILRSRVHGLMTYQDTHVPYIFLSQSSINIGDTVVRKGEVLVEKPSLILPPHIPQFKGFEFNEKEGLDENSMVNFLLVRGVHLPSLKYNNKTHQLDIYEGELSSAVDHYLKLLETQENVHTGLIKGPEECWQFSLLIFICAQIIKNADVDIKKILSDLDKRKKE